MQWTGPIPWMIVVGGGVFFAVLLAIGLRVKKRVKGTKSPLIYMGLFLVNFGLLGVLAATGAGAKVWFEQYKRSIDTRGKSNAEILALLDSGDFNVRYNAVQRVRPPSYPPAEAVPALTGRLDDGAMRVRMAALYALKRYGTAAKSAWPAMALRLTDHNARVRSAAHSVMRNCGPDAVDALWPLMTHEDKAVRDATVATIAKIKPTPVAALVRMVTEFEGDTYRSALRRLAKEAQSSGEVHAAAMQVSLAQLDHAKPEMRWAACWAVHDLLGAARTEHPEVVEAFATCVDTCILQLAKGPVSYRQRAAWLLGRYPEHAAKSVPVLITSLQDPPAQRAAAEALGDLGTAGEPAIPALIESLRDPGLAKFARNALEKLGAPALTACRSAHAALADDDPPRYRKALNAIVGAVDGE